MAARRGGVLGITLGLAAGLAFGIGGVFVKPLLETGWSPGAAVLARISIAAVLLAIPGLLALRGDLRPLWRAKWTILLYGLVAVAGVQFFFYASLERIPVSMTLLIEYLAPIVLVLFAWVRTRRLPQPVVIAGSVLALGGLVLVIGPGGGGLDVLGIAFAALAMIGVCVYYAIGESAAAQLPPVALIASGFVVGAIALGLAGLTGLLPMRATLDEVAFLGADVSWFVPLLAVGIISTAFAYTAGIASIGLLGSRLAAFLGLSEVVFAAIAGWVLLGEVLGPLQILGGLLILGGIVCVKLERVEPPGAPAAPAVELGAEPVPVTATISEITTTSGGNR
ncbi:EamA family transporter [Agromyces italicus]|uniref:EamA family transporter n=1 Tax=Agromyces italicus TaxID=279572 RepID=UPI0003B767E9|nr:EamA family transporter [Agromyces italicus]